jgi:phage terminase large subunit
MNEREFRVRRYQRAFHETWVSGKKKRLIEIAHRRWGKDEIALNATRDWAHKRIGTYWHCLPEYAQARKAIWTSVNAHTGKRRIDEAFPPEIRDSTNDQEMFIRFKCGSTWQLIGSDRYDATVGAGPVGIVYSEWALANPNAWGYHRPMVEENDGWAAFITTPRGRNHAYNMYNEAVRNKDRWFAELSPVSATNALTKEQIDAALSDYIGLYGDEDLAQAQIDQEYHCSFNAAILGAFYAKQMLAVRTEGRIDEITPDPSRPVHTAWDLGKVDSTAIWWFQVVGSQIFILDFYMSHGADIEHYAEVCLSKDWARGIDYVPHDARQQIWGMKRGRVEQMRDCGLRPVVLPQNKVLDGIAAARKTLPLCVFHPRTNNGIEALEQYRREWDEDARTFGMNPVHDWTSHAADAFRYLAMSWRSAPTEIVDDKPKPQPGQVYLPGPPEPISGDYRIRI